MMALDARVGVEVEESNLTSNLLLLRKIEIELSALYVENMFTLNLCVERRG